MGTGASFTVSGSHPDDKVSWVESRALRVARTVVQIVVLVLAFASAYAYRFSLPLPAERMNDLLGFLLPVLIIEQVALRLAGAHRQSWRYTSLSDIAEVIMAMSGASLVLMLPRFIPNRPASLVIPLGVILANWVASTGALTLARLLRRLQSERSEALRRDDGKAPRTEVLLIGAGRAGVMVAKEIRQRPELGLIPVGFLDDDPSKKGRRIGGIDVLGTTNDIERVAKDRSVRQVILTMAAVSRADIRRIVDRCREAGLDTRIIPGLFEIVGGQVNLNRIRPVAVEDLLGREPVELDDSSLHELLEGQTVLVTGAGGSIGSELARQAARYGPARLVLLERSEPALWAIHREVSGVAPSVDVVACMADVCDGPRMERVFGEYRPDVVIHAAAHKHVPLMEQHPAEAVKNNVGGTKQLVDLSVEHSVSRFVLVSTDKAVNPTSVMGATKRVAERYVQHVAATAGLHAVAVRFGNVLGSTGSVVPIFEEQVHNGGPVTVTHQEMVRYFMTIPEASSLVLQAGAIGKSGEVLILDMGEPVRIVDLAESIIRLSGFEPGKDIEIEFTGLRPGEKMFEEISLSDENATRTRHPKIWTGHAIDATWDDASADMPALLDAAQRMDSEIVRARLKWAVPEFDGHGTAPKDEAPVT